MVKNIRLLVVLLMFGLILRVAETQESTQSQEQETELQTKSGVEMDAVANAWQPCIVKIVIGGSMGSGLIWRLTEDEVVIASARHLLMQGVDAEVTFYNEETVTAKVLGLSEQYDVGFLTVTAGYGAEIKEAIQPLELALQERTQGGESVLQVSYNESYEGEVLDYLYIPEFGTEVLRTQCYSRAGMSGGGVFDAEGWLLGMIVGGASSGTGVKEAAQTYSLPTALIESEYQIIQNP